MVSKAETLIFPYAHVENSWINDQESAAETGEHRDG